MLAAADTQPSAASTIAVLALFYGLTMFLWFWLWRYVRPAIRSQEGQADRMSRDRRLRRISWALLMSVYPVMLTVSCLVLTFKPAGAMGAWTSLVFTCTLLGAMIAAVVMAVAALIFRTIDRHRGRARHRALGLPDPPAPWWPAVVVTLWATTVLALFSVGTLVMWKLVYDDLNRKGSLIESQLQLAMNDPFIQQLTLNGAPKELIDARLAALTGADVQFAQMKDYVEHLMTGNLVALGVTLCVIVVGGALLYRRQKRCRTEYDQQIAHSVSRAAQLTL